MHKDIKLDNRMKTKTNKFYDKNHDIYNKLNCFDPSM